MRSLVVVSRDPSIAARSAAPRLLMLFLAALLSACRNERAVEEAKAPGVIAEIAIATGIDDKGRAQNERFTFAPTEQQIVAIVRVGSLSSKSVTESAAKVGTADRSESPLVISWYRVTPGGDQKLFEHRVVVKSHDRAYSVATSQGALEAGSYKIKAALAGQVAESELDVRNRATTSGTATGGAPPVSGGSGVIPASASAQSADEIIPMVPTPTPPPCTVVWTGGKDSQSHTADASADINCPGKKIEVLAWHVGSSKVVEGYKEFKAGRHDFKFDPCTLKNGKGKDLPGQTVEFSANINNAFDFPITTTTTVTLGDDTFAPRQNVTFTPAGGQVTKGEKITVDVAAFESRNTSWQTGIRMIQVIADPGDVVGTPRVESGPPNGKPCLDKDWTLPYQAVYTVPKSATNFTLCAFSDDYVQRSASSCANFTTVPPPKKLQGSVMFSVNGSGVQGMSTSKTIGDLSLTIGDDGTITGTANVTYTYHGEGSKDCGKASADIGPLTIAVPIKGWASEEEMHLRFDRVTYSYTYNSITCGERDAAVLEKELDSIFPDMRLIRNKRGYAGEHHWKGDSTEYWSTSGDWKIELVPDDGRGVPVAAHRGHSLRRRRSVLKGEMSWCERGDSTPHDLVITGF